jgi:PAS domain-containing protein
LKLLAHPVFLRGAVVFCCSAFAFVLGLIFMRLLRKSIQEEGEISSEASPSLETLPLHVYNTVIQQLKQQKHELQVQSQAELNRARASETFSQSVLTNLPCGVLVFGANGLVKTSNPAAREILGFGSATGMGMEDIFRGAVVRDDGHSGSETVTHDASVFPDETLDEPVRLADEVDAVLRFDAHAREVHAEYETPAGERRFIAVRISPVPAADGSLLGVACLINDLSELERIRHEQEMRGELSAEMALQLRTSLTTISGYAQQLASSRDPELARQLAADIAGEAASLDRTLGGFLTGKNPAQSAAARATSR